MNQNQNQNQNSRVSENQIQISTEELDGIIAKRVQQLKVNVDRIAGLKAFLPDLTRMLFVFGNLLDTINKELDGSYGENREIRNPDSGSPEPSQARDRS